MEEKHVRFFFFYKKNWFYLSLTLFLCTGTYNLYNTPGIPRSAVSFSGGIIVTEQEASGFLTVWPASAPMPEGKRLLSPSLFLKSFSFLY